MAVNIGHVNCDISFNRITKENSDEELTCPYNFSHKVSVEDFLLHLLRCPEPAAKKESMQPCRFNRFHYYPATEKDQAEHERQCQFYVKDAKVVNFKKVTQETETPEEHVPLRQRRGMENPRVKPERFPDIKEVLGDVRYPEIERLVALRAGCYQHYPDDTEFRYGGRNAYEYVREFGVDDYENFDQFTRRMSRSEKAKFANFLEDERACIRARKEQERRTGIADRVLEGLKTRRDVNFDMIRMINLRGHRAFKL